MCKSVRPPGPELHFTFTGQTNLRNLLDISYNRYLFLESKPEIQIYIKKLKWLPLPPFQNGKNCCIFHENNEEIVQHVCWAYNMKFIKLSKKS